MLRVYPPVAVPQERVLRKDHVSVRGIRADVLPHRRRMGVVLQTGEGRGRAQPVVRRGGRGAEKAQRPHLRHPSGRGRVCLGRAVGRRQSRRRAAFAGYLRQSLLNAAICIEIDVESGHVYSVFYGTSCKGLYYGSNARPASRRELSGEWLDMDSRASYDLRRAERLGYYSVQDAVNVVNLDAAKLEDHLDQSGQRRNALAGLVEQRQSAEQGERIL